jgi:hypothetical protein
MGQKSKRSGKGKAADSRTGTGQPEAAPVQSPDGSSGPAGLAEPPDAPATTANGSGATPSGTVTTPGRPMLRGVPAIRAFFRRNTTPIYFVSPTPFNLLGVDRWVSNFHYVNYYDCFDGGHPRVFVPLDRGVDDFGSMEEMNNFLLGHPEFAQLVRDKPPGKAVMVMFDEETERLAAERGIEIALPPARLRHHVDSKLVTTRLGNDAGVPSVPNVLGTVDGYAGLLELAARRDLGTDLVVQLPFGDSGKTTFFIADEATWDRVARDNELTGVELKVMKRINCRPIAVEAVLTRHGTLVGPIMSDITGHPELTPYKGGWAGNDVYLDVLDPAQRAKARALTENLGTRLGEEGYRGFFEVDYLVDIDNGELYLGEINPRLSGISSMTNVTAGAYAELPLFLFHLLEYLDVDYEIDVAEINARWADPDSVDAWSQVVVKHTRDEIGVITEAPSTGVWRTDPDGGIRPLRPATDWHGLTAEDEGFYLRVSGPGDYLYKGADIGILVTRARLQSDPLAGEVTLTERCLHWVDGIRARVRSEPFGGRATPGLGAGVK